VAVHFAAGKAEMRVDNLAIRDYHNAANALGKNTFATAFDPAVVSFDVVWSRPITRRVHVADGTLGNNYAGEYVENQVTVTWSGTNLAEGFTFTANPGTFATSAFDGGFAELGHERNGTFAGGDDGDHGSSPSLASGSEGGGGREAVSAALALLGEHWALPPTAAAVPPGATDLALRDSWNDLPGGPGQILLTSGSQNGLASGFTGQDAPVVRAAADGALTLASDLAATSLVTDIGLAGEDMLLR
jgi:hypothetical protein